MNDLKKTMIAASCLVLSVLPVAAQTTPTKTVSVNAVPVAVTDAPAVSDTRRTPAAARLTAATARRTRPAATRVIVVSLEDRQLALVEDGAVTKVYQVAVGRDTTPSPTGTFTIVQRVENPTYYHEGQVVPPGPGNPVGTRWMGLNKRGYGIHGTNRPRSIGKAASHGCIRMRQADLEELFAEVRSGDKVEIVGERNEETAAIFGGAPAVPGAVVAAQTVVADAGTEQSPAAAAGAVMTVTAVAPVSE
jgi:lipoprotein-anchoring transpeptidase ErfK/SrfK